MRRTPKGRSEAERALDEDVRNAQALGVSYGKYKALCLLRGYIPCNPTPAPKRRKRRVSLQKIEIYQAFNLWKSGLSDAKIGKELGVRRQSVSAWRQRNGLPTRAEVKAGDAKYSDYLIVDDNGEATIIKRRE